MPYRKHALPVDSIFNGEHSNIPLPKITETKRLIDCSCIIADLLMNQGERPMKQRLFLSSEKLLATFILTSSSEEFAETNRYVSSHRFNYCTVAVLPYS